MAQLPPSARALIDESGAVAHLVTIDPDGSPQVTIVWTAIEDGEICVASLTPRRKLDNVRRDPRVAITWEGTETDDLGLRHYLGISGRGRVTGGGAPEFLRRIAPRFTPPGTKFPRGDDPPAGWMLRIAPERWRGYGPWGNGTVGG